MTGEVVTAALGNVHWRDNFLYLASTDGAVLPDVLAFRVRNETGGNLVAGDLVYVSSWSEANTRVIVAKADANVAGRMAVGVITATIANNANGTAWRKYRLTAQNTGGSSVGDRVYLSTTAGGWTLTAPSGTDAIVQVVGRVAVVDGAAGVVEFDLTTNALEKTGSNELQTVTVPVGGTGLTTMTAKGALPVATAATTLTALQVGTNDQVLTADSTQASGVKWAALPGSVYCHTYHSGAQSIPNATTTPLLMDSEALDTDTMHYTSAAALTGTVSNNAGSAAVVGVGTAFTTELSVGQLIRIPDNSSGAVRVVTVITDDTNLTVAVAITGANSGVTAGRYNRGIVFRTAGKYAGAAGVAFDTNATGVRAVVIRDKNGNGLINDQRSAASAGNTRFAIAMPITSFAQWDWVDLAVYQDSTVALDVRSVTSDSPRFALWRVA